MVTYDVTDIHCPSWTESWVLTTIRNLAQEFDLVVKEETTLLSKKGSIHCHLAHPKQPGLLEVTVWPRRQSVWIDMHDNRRADWNAAIIEAVASRLAEEFGGRAEKRPS